MENVAKGFCLLQIVTIPNIFCSVFLRCTKKRTQGEYGSPPDVELSLPAELSNASKGNPAYI
jgi:hypothetical protein